ncbi:hypothetical protein ABT299_30215 [Spirillospora sp. NPDC000708]
MPYSRAAIATGHHTLLLERLRVVSVEPFEEMSRALAWDALPEGST